MKTIPFHIFLGCALVGAICLITPIALAQNLTLRIVCYNIEDDIANSNFGPPFSVDATTPLPGLISPYAGGSSTNGSITNGGVLEGIGEEILSDGVAQPADIITFEETSGPSTMNPIVAALNTYYSQYNPLASNMYAVTPYQATESGGATNDGNGPNSMVYNTRTVQLLASVPVDPPGGASQLGSASGEYREVMRYEFAPAGQTPTAATEFYIYVSHYKSGSTSTDTNDRSGEAIIIRNDEAASLPANARVLYVGDYNVTGSSEPGYQTIIALNSPTGVPQGQGVDPLNTNGANNINWSLNSLLNEKTEEDYSLHYRDDLQVCTTNVYNAVPGGLALVQGTYHAFGNNGTTAYENSLTNGSDTALNADLVRGSPISALQLYTNLIGASDHLPVVADYIIPVVSPVALFNVSPTNNGPAPLTVTFTDASTGIVTNWLWNYGDGTTSNTFTTTSVIHTYTSAGVYTVTETVTGPGGSSTNTQANYITVTNPPTAPYQFYAITVTNENVTLSWQTVAGSQYGLEVSSNLATWIPLVSNLVAAGTNLTVTTNLPFSPQFYRAYLAP